MHDAVAIRDVVALWHIPDAVKDFEPTVRRAVEARLELDHAGPADIPLTHAHAQLLGREHDGFSQKVRHVGARARSVGSDGRPRSAIRVRGALAAWPRPKLGDRLDDAPCAFRKNRHAFARFDDRAFNGHVTLRALPLRIKPSGDAHREAFIDQGLLACQGWTPMLNGR